MTADTIASYLTFFTAHLYVIVFVVAMMKAEDYFERFGGVTIVIGRVLAT